jgi:hypothetical protein
MRLDDKPIGPFAWSKPDETGLVSLSGPPAFGLVRTLRDGQSLTIGSSKVSLSGLAAALLVMDDVQGRVGNESALARPGPRPATATPAAPALPVLHAAPPPPALEGKDALIAAVRTAVAADLKASDCEDAANQDDAQPLTRSEALVMVGCIMGAYQGSALVYRVPRDAPGRARRVELPLPPTAEADAAERRGELVAADYDPKAATLTFSAKGRGLADCGTSGSWVFDGADFKLEEYNYKGRCGGPPGDWLSIWRSAPRP